MKNGFVVILATILILTAGMIIISSVGYISLNNIRAIKNNIYSLKSYYLSEAGIEDSLIRLKKGMNLPSSNNLTINNGIATIKVENLVGGSKTIESSADFSGRFRKVRIVCTTTTDGVSFHYGAQAGDGGIIMGNNSRIKGNVFSNGSIIGLGGKGYIDNTVKVATIGSKTESLIIGEDAYAHNCNNCTISGKLYYSGGDLGGCSAVGGVFQSSIEQPLPLPISEEEINKWKNDAVTGGAFTGNYAITGGTSKFLGPIKIIGNLTVQNLSTLTITGTIWVTGNINLGNNSLVKLSEDYGAASGIIISDGIIIISNNSQISGSGEEGSYTMFLSTNPSLNVESPAINVSNNALGAIFYASRGLINLSNNMEIHEATGYKLYLANNAIIEYESGLEDVSFSSGPGGGWKIVEWKEIE
jgi:hypothetical protein